MTPLPKSVFAGRLCRIRIEGGLESALTRFPKNSGIRPIEGTKWCSFWLSFARALSQDDEPQADGTYQYPYICRIAEDRYIIVSTDSKFVDSFFEHAGIAGFVDSPRILVDRATRDLVFPPPDEAGNSRGRKYTIGAVYGAVEGYARALRNVSFFGDDMAEAALFRDALTQIAVTRLSLRDPATDKEVLSIGATGQLDFHFKGGKHLNSIDELTTFFRSNQYIEWRVGRTWQAL